MDDRFALLTYSTSNLGDEIQSIAAEQFLPAIDLRVDRERLNQNPEGARNDAKMILHGWHTHEPENWPPAPYIKPLITSLHITRGTSQIANYGGGLNAAEILLRGENLHYLRNHQPIGARDLDTMHLLREHGVDSYFSACLTLTLGSSEPRDRGNYVCAIDLVPKLLDHLYKITKSPIIEGSHNYDASNSYGERAYTAKKLLSLYAHAKCVVTSRLHCALPCLAMGTPVLFVPSAPDTYRFSGLSDLLHTCSKEDYLSRVFSFDTDDPPANTDKFKAYRQHLIEEVAGFCNQKTKDGINPPYPFTPEPLSESLLNSKIPIKNDPYAGLRTFHRVFTHGREFETFKTPDFLREISKIYAATGDYEEAIRLLECATKARPNAQQLKNLLDKYRSMRTSSELRPITPTIKASKPSSLLVLDIVEQQLTHLSKEQLRCLIDEISKVKARGVHGDFVEFGVSLGGAGICMSNQLDGDRGYIGYDKFEMIHPPVVDVSSKSQFHYEHITTANFTQFGLKVDQRTIKLIKGSYTETLLLQDLMPIAMAHINCDCYDSLKLCLDFIHPRLSRYGVIIVSYYGDKPECRSATDEFCYVHDDIMLKATDDQTVILKL